MGYFVPVGRRAVPRAWPERPRSTLRARALRAWDTAGLEPQEARHRHTAASYMAAAGLTPKEAQEAMGHAEIRTTLNFYAKAVPGWQQQAAAKLDAYLERLALAYDDAGTIR
jgi:integrase